MKNTVIIKGNRYGITLVLDKNVEFTQLITDLSKKLENAEDFFDSDRQLAVTFEGRELSNAEMDEILHVIQNHSKLNIQYVMDYNSDLEVTFYDIIQTAKETESYMNDNYNADYEEFDDLILQNNYSDNTAYHEILNDSANTDNATGLFYKGTLRSGQSLEAKDSIIIIGDVNPGASITASGNVVIIGALKGSVKAGADGNRNAFIMALSMSPILIQIADVNTRSNKAKKMLKSPKEDAMIATIVDNQISVELISKSAFHDMNI